MFLRILAGALLALVAFLAQPDPDALVAQGAGRLLEQQLDEASDSLFAALDEACVDELRLRLEASTDPRATRAFRTSLNVHNATRLARGDSALSLVETGEPGPVDVSLRLAQAQEGLTLRGVVRAHDAPALSVSRGPLRLPDSTSLVPPLLGILFALALRRVILALFAGVWVGAALLRAADGAGVAAALPLGLWDVFADYFRHELVDSFRIEVIGFVVALLGIIGVASRAGGIQGLVDLILRFARSVRSALMVSFSMGLLLFFDDYANCLVVGSSMRPVTDRLRISREKLAFIVDSTAAPVAGLSLLSTWIAFEVSTYAAQLPGVGISESAYAVFFWTIPFRFYSIFALVFVALVIWTRRDFGPMLAAERRARSTGQLVRPGGQPLIGEEVHRIEPSPALMHKARYALVPIGLVVLGTLAEIFRGGGGYELLMSDPGRLLTFKGATGVLFDGSGAGPLFRAAVVALIAGTFLVGSNALRIAIAAGVLASLVLAGALAPRLAAYLPEGLAGYAALAGCFALAAGVVAVFAQRVSTRRRFLPWRDIHRSAVSSTRALGVAVVILFLAWMIGRVCQNIGTADYLVALSSGNVAPSLIPILLFLLSCVVAFATGTSWGTMSILLPNVVALAAVAGEQHTLGSVGMVTVCIGAVLEGAIFGDHCSPISDTTVLSSVATGSDHIDHVRTQLPYALSVAAFALVAGYLPTMWTGDWPFAAALFVAGIGMWALLRVLGREVDPAPRA